MNILKRLLLVTFMASSMLSLPTTDLTTSGTLTVHVESESANPIKDVEVVIRQFDDLTENFTIFMSETTNSEGIVVFSGLPLTDDYHYSVKCISDYQIVGTSTFYLSVTEDEVDAKELDPYTKVGDPVFYSKGDDITFQLLMPAAPTESTQAPTKETEVKETTTLATTETPETSAPTNPESSETTETSTELPETSEPSPEETELTTPSIEITEPSTAKTDLPTETVTDAVVTTSSPASSELPQTGRSQTWPIAGGVLLISSLVLIVVKHFAIRQ